MSGVLHPVGPEPPRVYWVRRAVVVLVLVALVSLVLVVVNAVRGGSGPTAVPPPGSASPLASASPTPTPTPTSTPTSTPTPAPPQRQSASGSPSPSLTASPTPSARTAPDCEPAGLRPTLRGPQRLAAGKSATFALSFINGSKKTCTLAFDRHSYELKIISASGTRIWTTNDCPSLVKPVRALLPPEKAYEFSIVWNGKPSANGCKSRAKDPAQGDYFVTSQLEGAEPVQFKLVLT